MNMTRRKRPGNPLLVLGLLILIGGALYVNFVIVPVTPPLFIPTPTATRSPDSFLVDARSLMDEGKYPQAIAAYDQAIQADPRNINTYVEVARLQILYGDTVAALDNVANALLLNNNYSLAHALQGWALGRQGDYLQAEASLKKAIQIDPGNGLAYAFYAEILAQQQIDGKGDLTTVDRMIEMSRSAQQFAGDTMETHYARGLVLEATGNYVEAIQEFEAAVNKNEMLADLHLALGRNYRYDNQYDLAVTQFNRAIALKPDDPLPYLYTARTYMTVGDYAKAIQYAEQAIQQDPTDPVLYANLGTFLFRLARYNEAIQPLQLATQGGATETGELIQGLPLDTTSVEYYARLGLSLSLSGRCGEALTVGQSILQVFPDDETQIYNVSEMTANCEGLLENPPTTEATATPAP
jgi:tetratricopeptide (TPR) repeat protein